MKNDRTNSGRGDFYIDALFDADGNEGKSSITLSKDSQVQDKRSKDIGNGNSREEADTDTDDGVAGVGDDNEAPDDGLEPSDPNLPADNFDEDGRRILERGKEVLVQDIKVLPDLLTRTVDQGHVKVLVDSGEATQSGLVVDDKFNLVDGNHRLEAAKTLNQPHLKVDIYRYRSDSDRLKHAISLNARHGRPYTRQERKDLALRLFEAEMSIAEIARSVAVTERSVRKWTESHRRAVRKEQSGKVASLLSEGQSQKSVAEELGLTRAQVRSMSGRFGKTAKTTNGEEVEDVPDESSMDQPSKDPDPEMSAKVSIDRRAQKKKNEPQRRTPKTDANQAKRQGLTDAILAAVTIKINRTPDIESALKYLEVEPKEVGMRLSLLEGVVLKQFVDLGVAEQACEELMSDDKA